MDGLARLANFYRRVKAAGVISGSASLPTATPSIVTSTTKGGKTNGHYLLAPPTADEYSRYERMFRELGRDELAAWVPPHPSLTGLPPPSAGKGRGGGGSGGGDKKQRVSPQPPIKGQVGVSGSGVAGQGQGIGGDRWQAINKSPRINPGTSSPPAPSTTAAIASQSAAGAPQTPAKQSTASPPNSSAQVPHQPNNNPSSPVVSVDQIVVDQNSVTSPKKRQASEMEAAVDSPAAAEGAGGHPLVKTEGQDLAAGQSEGLSLGISIGAAPEEEGTKMDWEEGS